MNGLWLTQQELDRLAALVGQLKYVEALPIIQLLNSAHQRAEAMQRQARPAAPGATDAVEHAVPGANGHAAAADAN